MFFFEKKNQKTFDRCRGVFPSTYLKNKSFLLLFFKKEDLSFTNPRKSRLLDDPHPGDGSL